MERIKIALTKNTDLIHIYIANIYFFISLPTVPLTQNEGKYVRMNFSTVWLLSKYN